MITEPTIAYNTRVLQVKRKFRRECDGYPVVRQLNRVDDVWTVGPKERVKIKRAKANVSSSLQRMANRIMIAIVSTQRCGSFRLTVGKHKF